MAIPTCIPTYYAILLVLTLFFLNHFNDNVSSAAPTHFVLNETNLMHILNKKILKIINEKEVVVTSEPNNASVLPEDEWSPWWLSLQYTLPGQHPRKHQTRKHIKMDNKIIKRRCPNRRSKPLTWGIVTLTHQVSWFWENNNDTTGLIQKWWCYDYWLHCMLTLSLSRQNPNTFPVKGIKGTSIKGDSLVLLVQKKDYLYILGPVVWEKKRWYTNI